MGGWGPGSQNDWGAKTRDVRFTAEGGVSAPSDRASVRPPSFQVLPTQLYI